MSASEVLLGKAMVLAQQSVDTSPVLMLVPMTQRLAIEEAITRAYLQGGRDAVAPIAKRLGL